MNRILSIAVKTWRESIRDPKALAITLGLPIVFMVVFGFAFGGSPADDTYAVAVLDLDEPGTRPPLGERYVRALESVDILEVRRVASVEEGRSLVQARTVDVLVVVPADFTERLMASGNRAGARVEVHADSSAARASAAQSIVTAVLDRFVEQATGRAPAAQVASVAVTGANVRTSFDFIAPGLMVFAILNLAPQTAAVLAAESQRGTLTRLKMSRMRAFDLLAGVSLTRTVVSVLAVILMFVAAYAMGFRAEGNILVAVLVAAMAGLAVIGLGLIIAAFARNQDDAANVGVLVSVPASFLSGAFFPMPKVPLFEFAGRTIQIYDVIPTTHAANALRQVLTYGNGFDAIAFDLAALAVLAAALFAVGLWLYGARRLRAD